MSQDPRDPLDPQVKILLDLMAGGRETRVLEPEPMRAGTAALTPILNAGAPEVGREHEIRIPGPGGDLRALVFHPPEATEPAPPILLYVHGGGWVIMSPETHAKLTKELCVGAGCIVVSLDYRLAPEHPYPAPLEDCLAALRWLRQHGSELGGDPARVAMAGDSAGGNLTAAATLRLLAGGEAPPSAALMLCPATDIAFDTASMKRFAPTDAILDSDILEFFRSSYVSPEAWSDPFVSPLRGDVSGFPPTCIAVGGIDPLYDDGILFAEHLRRAGVPTRLLDYEGMPHIFMAFPGLDAAPRCIAELCTFLREQLAS